MKKVLIPVLLIVLVFSFTACGCEHEWTVATCLSPKTCNLCGAIEGEPIEHNYMEANCENPKRCSFCDATKGKALGHNYVDGSCTLCYQKDPSYVDLNSLGFTNTYGMTEWIEIVEYSFKENRVKAMLHIVYSFKTNYVERGGIFRDNWEFYLKRPTPNILESNYYEVSAKKQCNYSSNDSFSLYDDGFWEQTTIFERVVDSNNSKVILKTLNYKSSEEWFVPCELLDFTQITKTDDNYFYISFK